MVRIAVIGAGCLGQKIAGTFAFHGHRVKVYDIEKRSLDSVFTRLEEDKKELREDGILNHKEFVGQVLCLSRLEDVVKDAEFVIEAVREDLEVKRALFEVISRLCQPHTILCTNTLQLNVDDVFANATDCKRTLGLRFLYPVYYTPGVEISPTSSTCNDTILKARTLLENMGKTLFFRRGAEPLILTEDQREERKRDYLRQKLNGSFTPGVEIVNRLPFFSHVSSGPDEDSQSENSSQQGTNSYDCAICMDLQRNCVLSPCHHLITCIECAKLLVKRRDGCPVCRKSITEIIKIYHS